VGGGGGSDYGGGSGGGSAGGQLNCPTSFSTSLIGPVASAMAAGDLLDVVLQALPPPARAVCVHRLSGAIVGSIGGIPGLAVFLQCLEAAVAYEAHVDAIAGGRVDITVQRV
jgi:hypothetical protein